MIINQQNLSTLFRTVNGAFQRGFKFASPQWSMVATQVPSTSASNLYPWLGEPDDLREWLGDRRAKSLRAYSYTILNRDWEATIELPRKDLADDNIGVFAKRAEGLGRRAALHPDRLIFGDLMVNGTSQLCYDGLPMFSAAHPLLNGSTQSNLNAAGASAPWYLADLSGPIKPFIWQVREPYTFRSFTDMNSERVFMTNKFIYGVDARVNAGYGLWQQVYRSNQALNEANFEAAWNAMTSLVSDEGIPLGISPTHLIVSKSNQHNAARLIAPFLASGASNIHSGSIEIISSPFLPNS